MPKFVSVEKGLDFSRFFADEWVTVKIIRPSNTADAPKPATAGKVDPAIS